MRNQEPKLRSRIAPAVVAAGHAAPPLWKRVADYAFLEPAHFIMERKMLLTIRRLAENQKPSA